MRVNTRTSARRLLAPGWYFGEIASAQFFPVGNPSRGSASSSTGPVLDVEVITKGNENSEVEGIKLYDTQSLKEQSMWSAVLIAEAAFGQLDIDDEGEAEIEWSDMVGQPVLVRVDIQSFRGQRNNSIKNYAHISTPVGEDGFPILESQEAELVGGDNNGALTSPLEEAEVVAS